MALASLAQAQLGLPHFLNSSLHLISGSGKRFNWMSCFGITGTRWMKKKIAHEVRDSTVLIYFYTAASRNKLNHQKMNKKNRACGIRDLPDLLDMSHPHGTLIHSSGIKKKIAMWYAIEQFCS